MLGSLLWALVAFLLRVTPLYDPDCFWHLHTGRVIAETGRIPWHDVFSHTARGRPWLFIDVLADLGLYGLWRLGGTPAVVVGTALIGALTVGLCLETLRRVLGATGRSGWAHAALGPLLTAAVVFRVTPRPQTLTLLCFSVGLWGIAKARADASKGWRLSALTAAWQSLHPSGLVALAMTLSAALGSLFDSPTTRRASLLRWAPWVALSALGLGVSLRPIDRLRAGFGHVTDPAMAALITEWVPLYRQRAWSPALIALAALELLAFVGLGRLRRRELPAGWWIVWVFSAAMGLSAVRFLSFAAMGALGPAALGLRSLEEWVTHRFARAFGGLAAVVLGLPLLWQSQHGWGVGVRSDLFPVGATRYLERARPRGHLLNELESGGYLLWALEGRVPVFFDGRSWALYPAEFARRAVDLRAERLGALIEGYNLDIAVLRTDQRVKYFQDNPGWRLVYLDDQSFVAVRGAENEALARRDGLVALRLGDWRHDIARYRSDPTLGAQALGESERLVAQSPQSSYAWVLRYAALAGAQRHDEAALAAARAVTLGPTLQSAHRALWMSCEAQGQHPCRCREARWLVARSPGLAAREGLLVGCP